MLASEASSVIRVGSRSPEKAQQFAVAFGIPKHGSYQEVLDDPEVEAVYISTPIAYHQEWIQQAAMHQKHILCEKPAFVSYHAASETVALCREKNVRIMEAYSFIYHPQHARVRHLLAAGGIGSPRYFSGQFTFPRPAPHDFRLRPDLGGGVFHDAAGYPTAAAELVLGIPARSVFCVRNTDSVSGVDSMTALQLGFPDFVTAQLFVGFDLHFRSSYAVLGSTGMIDVRRAYAVPAQDSTTLDYASGANKESIFIEPADQIGLMLEDFSRLVAGEAPPFEAETALLRRAQVMEAAALSAAKGIPIEIDSVVS